MKKIIIISCVFLIILLSGCNLNPIVNQLNGNDGSILYKEATLSKNTVVEFKDDKGNVLIENSDIVKVYAKFSEDSNYYIEFEFTENGQSKFKTATEENIGKVITITANDEPLSSPTIPSVIDSSGVIVANNQSYDELIALFDKITK